MAPESTPDPVLVALEFAAILERLGVGYVVAGSLASSIHGEPRSTDDIDIVADLGPSHVGGLLAALANTYYADAEAVKVDVFVVGGDRFDAERVAQGRRTRIVQDPPRDLCVDTAEHTVLRKLEWFRRGGEISDRQWRDVLGILRAQGDRLDRARMDTWASRLGVSDLLERALRDAAG